MPMITLGLGREDPPLHDTPQETEIGAIEKETETRAVEAKEPSRFWEMLSNLDLDFNGLGEILSEPEGLVVLVIIVLACVVIYFLVSGAVALVQDAFFSGGPTQGLGS